MWNINQVRCPNCKSENITEGFTGPSEVNEDIYVHPYMGLMTCKDCGSNWNPSFASIHYPDRRSALS